MATEADRCAASRRLHVDRTAERTLGRRSRPTRARVIRSRANLVASHSNSAHSECASRLDFESDRSGRFDGWTALSAAASCCALDKLATLPCGSLVPGTPYEQVVSGPPEFVRFVRERGCRVD